MNYLDGTNGDEEMQLQATGKSWAALHVRSQDRVVKAHREAIGRRVLSYFEQYFCIAKQARVACIFAEDDCIKSQLDSAPAERGLFVPPKNLALNLGLVYFPQFVRDIIAPVDERTWKCIFPYAGMILVHGSTCDTDIGLTLTFAHELQHFLQYTNEKTNLATK